MLKDFIYKIENLHDFAIQCRDNETFSLIDKDIILQNLRDLYLEVTNMPLDGETEAADEFLETNDEFSPNAIDLSDDRKEEEEEDFDLFEEEEQGVMMLRATSSNSRLITLLSEEEQKLITEQLCGGSGYKFNQLVLKLEEIEDFDNSMLYLYENFQQKQESESMSLLADALNYKI